MPVGPRVLGHDPLVLGDQREKAVRKIEQAGVVKFRRKGDALLPFIPDK